MKRKGGKNGERERRRKGEKCGFVEGVVTVCEVAGDTCRWHVWVCGSGSGLIFWLF